MLLWWIYTSTFWHVCAPKQWEGIVLSWKRKESSAVAWKYDWMNASLQSCILYQEQRQIPNDPHGIPWPFLNIWNISAALNLTSPLDTWPVEWILLARTIPLSIVNTFEATYGDFSGCTLLGAFFSRLKEDIWNKSTQLGENFCSHFLFFYRSVNVMFPGAVYTCWELNEWVQCAVENFQIWLSFMHRNHHN